LLREAQLSWTGPAAATTSNVVLCLRRSLQPLSFTACIEIGQGQESSAVQVLDAFSKPLRWRVLRPRCLSCPTIYLQAMQKMLLQLWHCCSRLVEASIYPTKQHRKPNTSSLGGGAPNIYPRYGLLVRKSITSPSSVAMCSSSHENQLTNITR
jgi:hypothetical protein